MLDPQAVTELKTLCDTLDDDALADALIEWAGEQR